MKKVLFTLLFSIVFLSLSAQDFEIVSVESLPADMSAREEMKTDHNDRQCALLRIATQNITPEQRERFIFKADLGSEVVERASRNGEIWLWVSPGLKYLRIQHPDWGQYELRLIDHVARVEALHTYKITIKRSLLVSSQEQNSEIFTQQYLVFQLTPKDAILEVNGQLWPVSADGTARKFVDFGEYDYQVQAPNYYPETGVVTVNDPNNKKNMNVNLKPNFGWIEVKGSDIQGASVYVDNAFIGKVPCKSKELKSGEHVVKIAMDLYEPYSENIIVRDNEILTLTPMLIADFSIVTLKVDADAEIWVNDEKKGVRSWTGNLASGTYHIECRQANHESSVSIQNITNTMTGQTITLHAPKPIYGSLNVESTPDFANVYIDGNPVGETPYYIPQILIGQHELRITKKGYVDYKETIVIVKDERKQMDVTLSDTPEGAIAGLFSVSADRKVYFSKGNLQYQASTRTWRFAEHQWDYIGDANNKTLRTSNGWIDLFGWGTSGCGSNKPDMTSTRSDDYCDLGKDSDWGVYNAISNGGDVENTWRTLTKEEWNYVLNYRNTPSGIRFAKAEVNGINGLIVFPDDWKLTYYRFNNPNKENGLYNQNIISSEEWLNSIESYGAVFLPAAGFRQGIFVSFSGSYGAYWSINKSDFLYFADTYLTPNSYGEKSMGRSVRLVRDYMTE